MKQEGLQFFTDTYLTVIGLMVFLGYFILVFIKAILASNHQIQKLEAMPLQSEEHHHEQT